MRCSVRKGLLSGHLGTLHILGTHNTPLFVRDSKALLWGSPTNCLLRVLSEPSSQRAPASVLWNASLGRCCSGLRHISDCSRKIHILLSTESPICGPISERPPQGRACLTQCPSHSGPQWVPSVCLRPSWPLGSLKMGLTAAGAAAGPSWGKLYARKKAVPSARMPASAVRGEGPALCWCAHPCG